VKLKVKKCCLFAKKVTHLVHVVSEVGIATDPTKVVKVKVWPVPANVTELRSFLGICRYYRRFIKNLSAIAKCLHTLSEKGRPFTWTTQCQVAFENLKHHLINSPNLAHPDFTLPFVSDTGASDQAIGAVLSQSIDGHE
jgi:hypothetical protein